MESPTSLPATEVDFSDVFGDAEWQLLDDSNGRDSDFDTKSDVAKHDLLTAPLMTREAHMMRASDGYPAQYGVLGKVLSIYSKGQKEVLDDQRLYLNTNAPFSAIVCGVQGSGKSHTVSTMLECMLISNFPPIGSLKKPLSGLVLHYGEGGLNALPNEAAWLSSSLSSQASGLPVRVYVSRASLQTMRTVYSPFGDRVTIEPLQFHSSELDAAAILSMMAVGSNSPPLYMQIILAILRELGEDYTYDAFMVQLNASKKTFNPAQLAGLEQRLSLLNSFLDTAPISKKPASKRPARFNAGVLTIIDLSDPFLDVASACGLFEIIIRLFVRTDVGSGKVLVVDEAHKYLSPERHSTGLTNALLNLIRQQRHLAMRVIISTQEPTVVPPVLLDLCSVAVLHRFSSPTWWQHLVQHVPTDFSDSDAFDKVVKLQTGHSIVLAPSGIGLFKISEFNMDVDQHRGAMTKDIARFGRRYLLVKTRKRVTVDGGASILVLNP
ncbi:hypothetical protein M413DRAFT_23823 [Hebeloma cylindrosporum]|uniref:Zona occludens toxin N-terminal domain-containing protein n=1 Tax=Hebeloma cylindrosporum TaxID=76867 RepID=A0A0C3CQ72_HEBCY|nr:hypothetical protein M413DRAFT_23823 [Hebeloma cylindrosporum h7]